MNLIFENVRLLAYEHTPVFFDAGLRYKIEKRFSIEGTLLDRSGAEGVANVTQKENAVIDGASDYNDIYLNGIFFGRGKITEINFSGGTMVRKENYTYSIICYEEGNLFNATGGVYAGINWANARLITSLNESFEFEEDEQGNKRYNHSVSVRFAEYSSIPNGLNLAKVFAAELFAATSGLSSFLNSYASISNAKKLHTESYNIIDCSCSFTETVSIPKENQGNYSQNLSYSIQLDAEGFITVEETIKINGLTSIPYIGAKEGYLVLEPAAYTRCSTIYSAYGFSDVALFNLPVSRGVSTNKFVGTIELKSVFTNNPKYNQLASWEYTIDLERSSEGYYTVSEKGSIKGIGRPIKSSYPNALTFYTTIVLPGIESRLSSLYSKTGRALSLTTISQSLDKNEFEGTISYSISKTDNNLYTDDEIKKTEISIEITNPVHLTQKYDILNVKEIVQTQQQSTMGQKSISINLKGRRSTSLATYLTRAKTLCNNLLPNVPEYFLSDCNYSLSPALNDFSFKVSFTFVGVNKAITDITLD